MTNKIKKIVKDELIIFLIRANKYTITEIEETAINYAADKIANLIENEYDSILKLNNKKNYSNKINEIMFEKNCNMIDAWDLVEEMRSKCHLEPIFNSINSLYNWRSKNYYKKDK